MARDEWRGGRDRPKLCDRSCGGPAKAGMLYPCNRGLANAANETDRGGGEAARNFLPRARYVRTCRDRLGPDDPQICPISNRLT